MNAVMLAAEQNFRENKCRKAYKGVNFFKKGYVPNTSMCRESDGSMWRETRCLPDGDSSSTNCSTCEMLNKAHRQATSHRWSV